MKRPAMFNGYWTDLNGKTIRRVTRLELRELYRLWFKHADLRGKK